MIPERTHCSRCGMSFRIAEPGRWSNGARIAESTFCAEAGCGRRFWHSQKGEDGRASVGMSPADYRAFMGEEAA